MMGEETTVQTGKTLTVGAKTFKPGDLLPEYLMKQFESSKEYRNFYKSTLISMEDYLKAEKSRWFILKNEKDKVSEPAATDLPESEKETDNSNFDDLTV